jgi:hypothetical protein
MGLMHGGSIGRSMAGILPIQPSHRLQRKTTKDSSLRGFLDTHGHEALPFLGLSSYGCYINPQPLTSIIQARPPL